MKRTITLTTLIAVTALLSLLVGCGSFDIGPPQIQIGSNVIAPAEEDFAYHDLRVVLPAGLEQREDDEQLAEQAQHYFNNNKVALKDGEINFFFLHGEFISDRQSISIVGAFVNLVPETIVEFSGDITISCRGSALDFADIMANFSFEEKFVGELMPSDAMLFVFNVPAEGFPDEDVAIATREAIAAFTNVSYTTR